MIESIPPVVDYDRMRRLDASRSKFNPANIVCTLFVGICTMILYKRYKDKKKRMSNVMYTYSMDGYNF